MIFAALTALAWVAPKRLIFVTAAFPALGFFLLWGGSIWGPVAVMIGLGLVATLIVVALPRLGVIWTSALAVLLFAMWFVDPITSILDTLGQVVSWFTANPVRLTLGFTMDGTEYGLRDILPLQPHVSGPLHGLMPGGWWRSTATSSAGSCCPL